LFVLANILYFEGISSQRGKAIWNILRLKKQRKSGVQILCSQGRIPGAKRHGWSWAIPMDAEKPKDGRIVGKKEQEFDK